MSKKNTLEDFYNKLGEPDENGCVNWMGRKCYDGYGWFAFEGKQYSAHRFSYLQHYGEFDRKLLVCHTCDNRLCAAPAHLFLGTHQDNMNDMMRKNGHWTKRIKR